MIRFQADADLNQAILLATVRRFPSLDFQSATDAGLTDLEVLTLASEQDRILVTQDKKTMPLHFATFIKGNQSPGGYWFYGSPCPSPGSQTTCCSSPQSDEWVNRSACLPI